jgi:Uma2 family endonuclease
MFAMAVPYTSRFTAKEYLALEAVADTKHEFFDGYIIAMAGAEPEHNQIVENTKFALISALRDKPCRVLGSDQRVFVRTRNEYFYPDATVTCIEPEYSDPKPRSLVNPQVIVEVLSETTRRYDRGDKWAAYQTIPSLADYLMISSLQRELVHYQRAADDGSWTMRVLAGEGTTSLAIGVVLDLRSLYRLVPELE